MDKNKVLTDEEIQELGSKAEYWKEVSERVDKSPLQAELADVHSMLGTRILGIIEHYLELID